MWIADHSDTSHNSLVNYRIISKISCGNFYSHLLADVRYIASDSGAELGLGK